MLVLSCSTVAVDIHPKEASLTPRTMAEEGNFRVVTPMSTRSKVETEDSNKERGLTSSLVTLTSMQSRMQIMDSDEVRSVIPPSRLGIGLHSIQEGILFRANHTGYPLVIAMIHNSTVPSTIIRVRVYSNPRNIIKIGSFSSIGHRNKTSQSGDVHNLIGV